MREETGMAEHASGQPDHRRRAPADRSTGFIRFWVYVFGAAILVLIFLAIFNS